jgi:hypothetical protein
MMYLGINFFGLFLFEKKSSFLHLYMYAFCQIWGIFSHCFLLNLCHLHGLLSFWNSSGTDVSSLVIVP